MTDNITDTPRDPSLPPVRDTSAWPALRLLGGYRSWDGPTFNPGETARFDPREAAVMIALNVARRADEPDPALTPEPEPAIVRALRGFTDPDNGVCYGTGERMRLPGRVASALMAAGTLVLDTGMDTTPITARDARLARARERRQARGRQ